MSARTLPWWRALADAGAQELDLTTAGDPFPDGATDPWGHLAVPAPGLTAGQRAVLVGLDDQPAVPRLRRPEGPGVHPGSDPGTGPGTLPVTDPTTVRTVEP